MSFKIKPKVIVGYLMIYFMLIWNQTNLSVTFLQKFSLIILLLCVGVVFVKSKKLTYWCGMVSIVLIVFALFIRFTVGGIGVVAVISLLSSVYIVATTVICNKEKVLDRLVTVIVFLAFASLILWALCMIAPQVYETVVPQYDSLMTYRIYSDSQTYKEIHYVSRGLFLYTFREVDSMKNAGIFSEPGIYQMVLNLGIFIILFMDKYISCKNVRVKLLILVITLCTTQSTTGFIGLLLIIIFYLLTISNDKRIYSKRKILFCASFVILLLIIDFHIRGNESIFQIAIINKLFPNGRISLIDNASSAARVGTIMLTATSILHHPFGIGYTNLNTLLRTDQTGFVAAEILSFGAVWGIFPLIFVLWWIFAPLTKELSKSSVILFIVLYINTLLAQSNMLYPVLILVPIALEYQRNRN